jgi:hypothetical protein
VCLARCRRPGRAAAAPRSATGSCPVLPPHRGDRLRSLRLWRGALWEIVQPNLALGTYVTYEVIARHYLVPGLGSKRIDRLQSRDVQTWINAVTHIRRVLRAVLSQGVGRNRCERAADFPPAS